MKIKRFEQLNERLNQDTMKEIHDEFMGYVNAEENGEIDFEYTNSELFDFAGEIYDKYNLSLDDVRDLVDTYSDDWHISTFFGDIIVQDGNVKKREQDQIDIIKKELGDVGVDVTDEVVGAVNNILFRINDEISGIY